jgi:hypothetical protein
MIKYSPFSKELFDLDEIELQKLIDNSISEGWYIEFKSDFPKKTEKFDNLKISKSISAFANTKGGWLFYGVDSNDKNIATELCGIDISKYKNLTDQISQIISENIFPKPIFHFKTVKLKTGKYVFIILIEESPTPPYINSQGIIYQRENNQNNPIKDRYIIEKLQEKTEEYQKSIERFSNIDNFGETKGQSESNQSYLELYLFPTPFNDYEFDEFYTSDFFKNIASRFYQGVDFSFGEEDEKTTINLGLSFNSIYSSQNSLIIRPLNENNHIYKSTTAELFRNGGLKFFIPIREFNLKNIPDYYINSKVINYLQDNFYPDEFEEYYDDWPQISRKLENTGRRIETDFAGYINMIDGVDLIFTILIITSTYENILRDNNYEIKNPIGFRAKLTSTWRKFVFFDDDDYLEKIKLYNVPIAPKEKVEIPTFVNGNHYEINIEKGDSFFKIARIILEGIGLPDSSDIKFNEIMLKIKDRFKN